MNEVEVFVAGEKNYVVIPPTNNIQKKKASQRWSMLKVATRFNGQLSRSLKKEEKDFLYSLNNHEPLPEKDHCEARKELTEFLDANSAALPDAEVEYLRKLVTSPTVSSDIVKRAKKSCRELLQHHNEPEKKERPQLSRNQQGASFRKELWTVSRRLMHLENERDDAKKVDSLKEKEEHKSPLNFLSLFTGTSQGVEKEEKIHDSAAFEEKIVDFTILGTSGEDPDCHPHVLTPPIMDQIRKNVPFVVASDHFWLKYSMLRDGASMRALTSKMRNSSRSVLAIETMDGDVFGAFVSAPWNPRGQNFFGSGEAFLWRMGKSRYTPCKTPDEQFDLESEIQVFKWSGENRNVQRLERADSQLIIGGGGPDDGQPPVNEDECGCAIVISPSLENGYSNTCLTFKSPPLLTSGSDTFTIANVEVWTLTPVDSVEEAEKVELGRRFIFDHTNFVEN